jgi:hypothetical protein
MLPLFLDLIGQLFRAVPTTSKAPSSALRSSAITCSMLTVEGYDDKRGPLLGSDDRKGDELGVEA